VVGAALVIAVLPGFRSVTEQAIAEAEAAPAPTG
jgi:hypothetical protein